MNEEAGTKYRRSYMREWRESAGLKLRQLAEVADRSIGTLSKIEVGELPYSQPVLEAYAELIGCTPGALIDRKPQSVDDLIERIRSNPAAAAAISELLRRPRTQADHE